MKTKQGGYNLKYQDFKHLVTASCLGWGLHNDHFAELCCMIAAHESSGCKHRRQLILKDGRLVPEGTARGVLGIEPRTHSHVWDDSDSINARAKKYGVQRGHADRLIDDDVYCIWVARHYILMDTAPLPTTPQAMAEYAKSYWNRGGAASAEKYLNDWQLWREGKL